ncbi:MAG: hypothetical protein JOZ89_02820 [Gammaproteobacteria bacterium]|nr:hypothetical protein [Gammaproteobacteria bacterium]
MRYHYHAAALVLAAATVHLVSSASGGARADVTIEQQTTFDLAFIKAHGTATEYTTVDKQRRDSSLHCEGFMSMLCGNTQSADIVRLDKEVDWALEPKKKAYRETAFMTAAQRKAAEQQAQAMMEKMKQCPAMQNTQSGGGPDTSKCQMSPPKLEVKSTGSHAMFAGHDSQLTQVALTNSCTNKETGDVCDFVFLLDTWLTQDAIAGLDEKKAFQTAHMKKLGLSESNAALQKQMSQFLAAYSDQLKELSAKAGDLKGFPLKTSVRIAFGGEHCASAKSQGQPSANNGNVVGDAGAAAGTAAAGSASGAAGSAAGTAAANAAGNNAAGSVFGSAANAFSSKLVSGLFAKKKTDAASPAATANTGGADTGLPPGMAQLASITTETTSISTAAIPAAQFDIPAGWTLIPPSPAKEQKEFTCPKAGGA